MSKVLLRIKEFGNIKVNNNAVKIVAGILTATLILSGIYFANYSNEVNKGIAENLIRLHVIANSDSQEDQALKLEVRDLIISYMKEQLKDSKNLDQTKEIVEKNIPYIQEIARNEIIRQGKDYSVTAMMGNYPFPTKNYGDVTLPAGNYDALRVVIGSGKGANWWCVLFPPLCFVDATHGKVSDSVKEDLKNTLTDEEYKIITSADSDSDLPIKLKFKIVEFFQDSRIKFSGMFSRIFN